MSAASKSFVRITTFVGYPGIGFEFTQIDVGGNVLRTQLGNVALEHSDDSDEILEKIADSVRVASGDPDAQIVFIGNKATL